MNPAVSEFSVERLLQEPVFKATTSGGKGGQNVNKVATRVELYFEIEKSTALNEEQKALVHAKLMHRISGDGVLRITGSEKRTQLENKELVKKKFIELIRKALAPRKPRKQTAPTKSAIEERLRKKKLQSERKLSRTSKSEFNDF